MRNYRKLLACILVAGVLLGGLGAGVALAEYSTLEYAGERTVGAVDMTTEEFKVELPAGSTSSDPLTYGDYYYSSNHQNTTLSLEPDNTVPKGTLLVRITYNRDRLEPDIFLNEDANALLIDWYHMGNDDVKDFFACKDQVLADLKDRKIGSYSPSYVESVNFLINSADQGRFVI